MREAARGKSNLRTTGSSQLLLQRWRAKERTPIPRPEFLRRYVHSTHRAPPRAGSSSATGRSEMPPACHSVGNNLAASRLRIDGDELVKFRKTMRRKMSARTLIPVAMVSAALMTTAAFAQTGTGGSPGATAPGNPSAPAAGGAAPNTTGSGMTSPNPTVPNANINPGTGQKYDPSNLNDMNNPNNPATRR